MNYNYDPKEGHEQEAAATESEAQDQAMEATQDAEEGSQR